MQPTEKADPDNFGQLMQTLRQPQGRSKPDRVPGGKRSAQFQRKYAAAVKAVEDGVIAPEVKLVAAHVSCGTRTASSILTRAVKDDERFSRDTRGRVTFKAVA